jgi:hypothetical protein
VSRGLESDFGAFVHQAGEAPSAKSLSTLASFCPVFMEVFAFREKRISYAPVRSVRIFDFNLIRKNCFINFWRQVSRASGANMSSQCVRRIPAGMELFASRRETRAFATACLTSMATFASFNTTSAFCRQLQGIHF